MEVKVISCKIIFVVNNKGKQEDMCLAYEIDDIEKTKRIVLVTHDSENKSEEEERSIINIPVKLEVTGSASSSAAKSVAPPAPYGVLKPGDCKPAESEGLQKEVQVISENDETATSLSEISHSHESTVEKKNEGKKGGNKKKEKENEEKKGGNKKKDRVSK